MKQAVEALSSLAQETRLQIFRALVRAGAEGMAAGRIAETLGVPKATLSFHLAHLTRSGLLDSQRRGRSIIYAVRFDGVRALLDYLMEDCCQGSPEVCEADGSPASGCGAGVRDCDERDRAMSDRAKVLFLCTGNSCRSQMAEGFLRELGGDRFEALSAGTAPKDAIHPLAIQAMAELGIDISVQATTDMAEYLGRVPLRYMIAVCDRAQQSCPRAWPGFEEVERLYWPFDDPDGAAGSEEEKMAVFRRVRDEIRHRVADWLAENN